MGFEEGSNVGLKIGCGVFLSGQNVSNADCQDQRQQPKWLYPKADPVETWRPRLATTSSLPETHSY